MTQILPWLPVIVAGTAAIAWLIRLEAKAINNGKDVARLDQTNKEQWGFITDIKDSVVSIDKNLALVTQTLEQNGKRGEMLLEDFRAHARQAADSARRQGERLEALERELPRK